VLQILGVSKEDEGLYRCMAFNSARKRFSQDASLTVSPGIIQKPVSNYSIIDGFSLFVICSPHIVLRLHSPHLSDSHSNGLLEIYKNSLNIGIIEFHLIVLVLMLVIT